ncbi:MAG: lysylphosphatidylglycerol synthase transmembrane domain-containing protein [bacterium]
MSAARASLPASVKKLLRVAVGAGLLGLLLGTVGWGRLTAAATPALGNWPWLAAAVAWTGVGLFLAAERWGLMLTVAGISMRRGRLWSIYLVGQFFNAFLLGACGGDVVRAWYAARQAPQRSVEAAATILLDRGLGLLVMVFFCCGMILLRIHMFLDYDGPRDAGFLMLLFLAAGVAGTVLLFQRRLLERFGLFRQLERSGRVGSWLNRCYEALYLYRHHPRVVTGAVLLSLGNLLALTLACHAVGQALGLAVSLADYFVLFPLISVIAAVPLTPGGLGVREGLFVGLFQSIFVPAPQALVLSLLVYATGTVWSLIGGVIYTAMPEKRTVA